MASLVHKIALRARLAGRLPGIFEIKRILVACLAASACSHAAWGSPPAAATTAAATAASSAISTLPLSTSTATASARHVNLATFDGDDPPMDRLQAFDAVVLDPARSFDPASRPLAHTIYLARTTAQPGERADAFVEQEIAPLWQRGFRGFVLDTPVAIAALDAIRAAHPDAAIVLGGADALNAARAHAKDVYAVLAGPFFTEPLAAGATADATPAASPAGALEAAKALTRETGVPVVTLEYCDATDRACARHTAQQALAAGLDAYVTDPDQDVVGIGRIEVMPRKVLVVQDRETGDQLDLTPGVRVLATPLNYLGYDVQYADISGPLPANVTPDRYAGVVVWIEHGDVADQMSWRRWIRRVTAAHVPIAFLGQFGFSAGDSSELPGLASVSGQLTGPLSIVTQDPMVGFETMPKPDPRDLPSVRVAGSGRSLLGIDANGTRVDAVGVMPWGGFALNQYTEVSLSGIDQERWVIQPISFLKATLRLAALPGPSTTTQNGRRLFMTHVDGDGFASRAEFPGPDYSGEALYERIWTRYPVPTLLSVIEGEVGPDGLYPAISPRLEAIARKMFALPYVEIGTHTYSHPFIWEEVNGKDGSRTDRGGSDSAFSLNIPGYHFNLDREIFGSIKYINTRLAPPGKKVLVLQWSGDCMPPAVAVKRTYDAGVYNFNGGDTVITRGNNSWTNIAPIGIDKGPGAYQVLAPNQDENVYTNDWQGPFYGFDQVLQTFEMTDKPLRFKPIDIYYHMYSGTKLASLRSLDTIMSTVLAQPVLPVQVTDYERIVLDWHHFAVARDGDGWLVRGNGSVSELHWNGNEVPRLADASGVTGYSSGPDGTYIHFDGGSARFTLAQPDPNGTLPYLAEANGFVRDFERTARGLRFEFGSYYQPFIDVAHAGQCRASSGGRALTTQRQGDTLHIVVPAVPGVEVTYQPVEVNCGQ
ncbi:polysaccharide deacetylase family protein [Paraburkholderia sp. B3]|uniref:polysaccharide deacetylase family protein n=1 Tax=Paraburkholderia sp. B3 TaxID=3134791 RepID=UPI0039824A42